MSRSRARFSAALLLGCGALLLMVAWSLTLGRFGVAAGDVFRALWAALTGTDSGLAANAEAVVLHVRAPRVLAALAVGAALAGAGAAYQALFRNPLVSPDILGVTSGCSLGAAVALLLGWSAIGLQAMAFGGGLAAVAMVVALAAALRGRDALLTLILTGVVVGSLFAAGIAMAKTVADPQQQLPAITFWLLGSFAGVAPADLAGAIAPLALGAAPLVLLRWRLDALALSDDEARSLGVEVRRLRLAIILGATLMTAAAVALAGAIGWVGLVVPHAARLMAGPGFARVLPLSLLLGAAFMLAVDTLCRTALATEIPPGIVTAIVGTPVFILLLAFAARRTP
ncbi:MAG TPA: iron ABC transporter permease [Usitatibacter sp.]|nr:iron ABC transporter permease [Usitatibacter sp.]